MSSFYSLPKTIPGLKVKTTLFTMQYWAVADLYYK